MHFEFKTIEDRWAFIDAGMHRAAVNTVNKILVLTLNQAKRNITKNDSIITGNMINSGYVSIFGENNYTANTVDPGIRLPIPAHDLEGSVNFAAHYSGFVEKGTVLHPGKPFLLPALEAQKPKLVTIYRKNLKAEGF